MKKIFIKLVVCTFVYIFIHKFMYIFPERNMNMQNLFAHKLHFQMYFCMTNFRMMSYRIYCALTEVIQSEVNFRNLSLILQRFVKK